MIWRPGTADHELAVFQLLGRAAVPVLIFFDGFRIDEVCDIDQHAVGVDSLAADFFFERIEKLVDLVIEKGKTSKEAALITGINLRTARHLCKEV